MPDKKGNLYLFEAIELRNEYDRHIKLIQNILGGESRGRGGFLRNHEDEEKVAARGFDRASVEQDLKSLQTKRVKLNQALQATNFRHGLKYDGEEITLAEALEVRKHLLAEVDTLAQRVENAAYKRIIHKEERDIEHEPTYSFKESYDEYKMNLKKLRNLITAIHTVNHRSTVTFKDEP